jgi:hypothetical protein
MEKMTKTQLKETIRNLQKDTDILVKENCHPRTKDLQMMVMTEDLPEILKLLNKLYKVFNFKPKQCDNQFSKGYNDALNDLKREIFDD